MKLRALFSCLDGKRWRFGYGVFLPTTGISMVSLSFNDDVVAFGVCLFTYFWTLVDDRDAWSAFGALD